MNNVVIAIALIIGASWAWGSIGVMQRNYDLQKTIDTKSRQETLAELETQNLIYEQNYYRSGEYQELALRERLGLANSGEKALILPPNSVEAKTADMTPTPTKSLEPENDFQQWMNFLFGGNHSQLQK